MTFVRVTTVYIWFHEFLAAAAVDGTGKQPSIRSVRVVLVMQMTTLASGLHPAKHAFGKFGNFGPYLLRIAIAAKLVPVHGAQYR